MSWWPWRRHAPPPEVEIHTVEAEEHLRRDREERPELLRLAAEARRRATRDRYAADVRRAREGRT